MPLFLCLAFWPYATLATAADWVLRPGDQPFDQVDLASLAGQSFTFFDDGRAAYGDQGAYSYTYSAENGGGTAHGSYNIAQDGSVCVVFANGRQRCDLYVRNGVRVILISETGDRYPVRP